MEENRAREEWNVRADEWASKTNVPQTLYNDHYAGAEAETGDKDPREAKYQKGQNLKRQWERDVEGPLRRHQMQPTHAVYRRLISRIVEKAPIAVFQQGQRLIGGELREGIVGHVDYIAYDIPIFLD